MTPLVFLVGFCLILGMIVIGRVVSETSTRPTDGGSASIVLGITVLSVFWVALEESLLTSPVWIVIVGFGSILIAVGVALVIRRWDESVPA
ncbi:hypothetical protein [Halostagnicola sp. A-GB9-2]|uniref:hypothetical protein n=1 Tax=Halostagnicola sp. A-GB9-2 TaxID=3048066 RepID=UPI0024C03EA1|nr:hypothetical protein [Halostagnicola sp. A-GB9-2]MDJ1431305.1 hypothetical protein [Halostagnicola sp. A-GB9-2]